MGCDWCLTTKSLRLSHSFVRHDMKCVRILCSFVVQPDTIKFSTRNLSWYRDKESMRWKPMRMEKKADLRYGDIQLRSLPRAVSVFIHSIRRRSLSSLLSRCLVSPGSGDGVLLRGCQFFETRNCHHPCSGFPGQLSATH